ATVELRRGHRGSVPARVCVPCHHLRLRTGVLLRAVLSSALLGPAHCPIQVRACFPRAHPVPTIHHLRPVVHPSSACVSKYVGAFRGSSGRPLTAPPHRTSMSNSRYVVSDFPERSFTASESFHDPCTQGPGARPRKPQKDIQQKSPQQARTYSANIH